MGDTQYSTGYGQAAGGYGGRGAIAPGGYGNSAPPPPVGGGYDQSGGYGGAVGGPLTGGQGDGFGGSAGGNSYASGGYGGGGGNGMDEENWDNDTRPAQPSFQLKFEPTKKNRIFLCDESSSESEGEPTYHRDSQACLGVSAVNQTAKPPLSKRKQRSLAFFKQQREEKKDPIQRPQLVPEYKDLNRSTVKNNFSSRSFYKPEVRPSIYKNFLKPQLLSSLEDRSPIYVDTEELAVKHFNNLLFESVLGVDMEFNNQNFYQGHTCLIQISSAKQDFVIDPFPLHSQLEDLMKDLMSDPTILKVFCGGDNDFKNIQRDYSVVPVKCVDIQLIHNIVSGRHATAGRVGLADLSEKYLALKIKKGDAIRDWRRRPLPPDMKAYGHKDSFTCLAIYNAILTKLGDSAENVIQEAIESTYYAYPIYLPRSFKSLDKTMENMTFDSCESQRKFEKIFEWRREMCKFLDEPPTSLLPDQKMFQLATLPISNDAFKRILDPHHTLIGLHASILYRIITGGEEVFEKLKQNKCNKCAKPFHPAVACNQVNRRENEKEYYKNHPDKNNERNHKRQTRKRNNMRARRDGIAYGLQKQVYEPREGNGRQQNYGTRVYSNGYGGGGGYGPRTGVDFSTGYQNRRGWGRSGGEGRFARGDHGGRFRREDGRSPGAEKGIGNGHGHGEAPTDNKPRGGGGRARNQDI